MEAVTEDPRVKGELFASLDERLPDAQFLASNTSAIPIAEIASWTRRPERVVGLHFFSPVPVMKLVEVVVGLDTAEHTVATAEQFAEAIGNSRSAPKTARNSLSTCSSAPTCRPWLLHLLAPVHPFLALPAGRTRRVRGGGRRGRIVQARSS